MKGETEREREERKTQKMLYFNPQLILLKVSPLRSPNPHCFPKCSNFSASIRWSLLQFSNQTQTFEPIVCARRNRRRSGSPLSTKFILESMWVIASSLKILPEPLNLVVSELCAGNGNGGGLGFRKGFGGGGGFDGWRGRKRRLGLTLFGLVMVFGFAVLIGRELGTEYFWGVLGVSLFGFSIGGWKRGFKDWVLGFCCCAVLMGLGLRNQEVLKWLERSRVCSPIMNVARRRRRKIKP